MGESVLKYGVVRIFSGLLLPWTLSQLNPVQLNPTIFAWGFHFTRGQSQPGERTTESSRGEEEVVEFANGDRFTLADKDHLLIIFIIIIRGRNLCENGSKSLFT